MKGADFSTFLGIEYDEKSDCNYNNLFVRFREL